MAFQDDDLQVFASEGAPPLPEPVVSGQVEHSGAKIWYATFGQGQPVVLLHGGLGHSGNWGYQVPAIVAQGYQVTLIDSRGHGRSTRNNLPYSYELMAEDVRAVMAELSQPKFALVGWSDGACTALVLAAETPQLVAGLCYFACNMDNSGVKDPIDFGPTLDHCIARHRQDYRRLSATPDDFQDFFEAVGKMQQTQPNYSAADLAAIKVPVLIVQSEYDEFIKLEHAEYLARTIPRAGFKLMSGVSHFAPLQRPDEFNQVILNFLENTVF